MKRITYLTIVFLSVVSISVSCKKNRASEKIDGEYLGHFDGVYNGIDTIVNTGYKVFVTATDKNEANVTGSLFGTFQVLVTPNGLNVELVSAQEGLHDFLFEGETNTLSFYYTNNGDTAHYNGTK